VHTYILLTLWLESFEVIAGIRSTLAVSWHLPSWLDYNGILLACMHVSTKHTDWACKRAHGKRGTGTEMK